MIRILISSLAYSQAEIKMRIIHLRAQQRSEEHTSELQSRPHLVCRLLLEKKKRKAITNTNRECSIAESIKCQFFQGSGSRSTRPDGSEENEGCIFRTVFSSATARRSSLSC